MAIFCTLDAIAGYSMFKQYFNTTDDIFTKYEDTIRTIIFFCIWGTYAYKSERVKGTCLRTYRPADTVHRAEKPHPFDEDFLKPYPMSEQLIETRFNEDKIQNDSMDLDQSSNQNAEK